MASSGQDHATFSGHGGRFGYANFKHQKGNPMSDMVHVIAVITTKAGQRADVLKLFNANVPAVLAEDGCIEYGAAIDTPDAGPFQTNYGDDTFVVIEKWASMGALMAHAAAPHMKSYGTATKDMLADRKIHILSST
jgi:quinol monooxygenase YgiN